MSSCPRCPHAPHGQGVPSSTRQVDAPGAAFYSEAVSAHEFDLKLLFRLVRLGLLDPAEASGSFASQRDSVARALPKIGEVDWWTDGGAWGGVLAQVCPPPKGRRFKFMGSEGYLSYCKTVTTVPASSCDFGEIVVVGDMFVGALSKGSLRGKLPRVTVLGDVHLSNCSNLESVEMVVLGHLTISMCPKLRNISGEIFGVADISNCGLESLGADFRVAQSLEIHGCPRLSRVNCAVGENFRSSRCGDIRYGPAFSSKNRVAVLRRSGLARPEKQGALKDGTLVGRPEPPRSTGGSRSRAARSC